ncbi:MAG TPA: TonB-dependent receptor plug domain-containing protein, partial [Burkholderiaceae bacterium]
MQYQQSISNNVSRKNDSRSKSPYRLRPVAAVVAATALITSSASYAADPSVADLQAEIAQLKQIIASQRATLDGQQGKSTPTALPDAAPAAAPALEDSKTLGEVTVSGAPPLARLQDAPVSASAVSGADLAQTGAASIAAITQRLANVTWNFGNQRTQGLSVRGIGKIGQTEAQDPDTGVTVDGVPYAYNPLVSSYDFIDVDNASVIRGPQGTSGGKSTTVGNVAITTNRPSFTPSADYSLTFGQEGTFIGKLAAGGPIVDNLLAWRGTFTVNRGDGNLLNLYNNDTTYTNTDRVSGRVQFLLTPSADFNARLSFNIQPNTGEATNNATIYTPTPKVWSNGAANTLPTDSATRLSRSWFTNEPGYSYLGTYLYGAGQNAVDVNAQQPLFTSTHGASAELNWNVAKHTLTSITAYQDYYFDAVNDEGTPFDITTNNGGFQNYYRQVSQEFKIASQPGEFVDYQAGLYFLKDSNNAYYNKAFGSDAGAFFASNAQYKILDATAAGQLLMQNSLDRVALLYNAPAGYQDIENKDEAIYGEADWHFTDKLTLTSGLRISHDERVNNGHSSIVDSGFGAALNPVTINGVQTGGFATTGTGALAATNSATQLSLADSVAQQYFGVKTTGTPGAAYSSLTAAQQLQVATAQAVRKTNIGILFKPATATYSSGALPTALLSPSYKINDNVTTYTSWRYGEKAGVAEFVNAAPTVVQPERVRAFEWGLKTS